MNKMLPSQTVTKLQPADPWTVRPDTAVPGKGTGHALGRRGRFALNEPLPFGLAMLLLLLGMLNPLAAQEVRYYDVEVVLFENLDPAARESELWPENGELALDERTIEVGQPWPGPLPQEYDPALTFKPLTAEEYRLTEQAAKIAESPSRRILLHTGWRQPGMPQDKALKVHFKRHIPADWPDTPVHDEGSAAPASSVPAPAGERDLEGLIQVMLARYLHVRADIVLRPGPASPAYAGETNFSIVQTEATPLTPDEDSAVQEPAGAAEISRPVVYRLQQIRRRMRSRELHYLDHPVIGMLIQITPYEPNPG